MSEPVNHELARQDAVLEERLNTTPAEYKTDIRWLAINMQSTIMAMMYSTAAEIEHDLISQLTREALQDKKAKGERLGRPPGPGKSKLDPFQPEIEALQKNGTTKTFVAKRYGTSAANLHLWLKSGYVTRQEK